MTILEIDPLRINPSRIEQAAAILKSGGVVAFPTETFYGLAADAGNEGAIRGIFAVKGRSFHNPIALIIVAEQELALLTDEITEEARKLMAAFWPGPLTLVFKALPTVSPLLTAGTGKIGIRISSHPVAHALAAALGHPLTATSANRSGLPECTTAAEVRAQLWANMLTDTSSSPSSSTAATVASSSLAADTLAAVGIVTAGTVAAIIDGGPTPGGKGSTFLDVSSRPPKLLREGAIPGTAITSVLSE